MHTQNFVRTAAAVVGVLLVLGLGGCAADKVDKLAQVTATPTTAPGWEGVKNVSRAGRFTFAGQPTEAAIDQFASAGGAMVIDIRTHQGSDKPGFDERARVETLGMKYVNIPITAASLSRADVEKFAQLARETQGPILLHCASSNRVGGLWAAYLAIDDGVPTKDALAAGKSAGLRSEDVEAATLRVIGR